MKPPKIDAKTREFLRRWSPFEVPTAQVTGGRVPNPGTYRALPVLGGMGFQDTALGRITVCGVHFILIRKYNDSPFATLSLGMPITKNTELHVNAFLHLLGWDGRVWPTEQSSEWPDNNPDEVEQLVILMRNARMGATLTFPPTGPGVPVLEIPVYKCHSPFQVAPFESLPDGAESPVVHLARFRELAKDPTIFEIPN